MTNRPYGDELLTIARRTLLDELLPLIPAEKTYDVLMVANAMAIAARELNRHNETDSEAVERIAEFYRGAQIDTSVIPCEQSLADQIRKRLVGAGHAQPLHALLTVITRAKLAISNPKYLGQ